MSMTDIHLLRPELEKFLKELNDTLMASAITSRDGVTVGEIASLIGRMQTLNEQFQGATNERQLFDIAKDDNDAIYDLVCSPVLFDGLRINAEPLYDLTLDTIFDDYIYPERLPPATQLPLTLGLLMKILEEGKYERDDFTTISYPHDFPFPNEEQQMSISMARLQAMSDRLQAWVGNITPQYLPPEKKVRTFDIPFDPNSHNRPVGELFMLIPGRIHELLNFMPDGTEVTEGEHKETLVLTDRLSAWIERNRSVTPDVNER